MSTSLSFWNYETDECLLSADGAYEILRLLLEMEPETSEGSDFFVTADMVDTALEHFEDLGATGDLSEIHADNIYEDSYSVDEYEMSTDACNNLEYHILEQLQKHTDAGVQVLCSWST